MTDEEIPGVAEPKVTHVPMSAWTLVAPAPGACEVCAVAHDPAEPHNPESLYWSAKRQIEGKPAPTWADALAHVEDPLRQAWVDALAERGVTVEGEAYIEVPAEDE
jgi:hypothetical protein